MVVVSFGQIPRPLLRCFRSRGAWGTIFQFPWIFIDFNHFVLPKPNDDRESNTANGVEIFRSSCIIISCLSRHNDNAGRTVTTRFVFIYQTFLRLRLRSCWRWRGRWFGVKQDSCCFAWSACAHVEQPSRATSNAMECDGIPTVAELESRLVWPMEDAAIYVPGQRFFCSIARTLSTLSCPLVVFCSRMLRSAVVLPCMLAWLCGNILTECYVRTPSRKLICSAWEVCAVEAKQCNLGTYVSSR